MSECGRPRAMMSRADLVRAFAAGDNAVKQVSDALGLTFEAVRVRATNVAVPDKSTLALHCRELKPFEKEAEIEVSISSDTPPYILACGTDAAIRRYSRFKKTSISRKFKAARTFNKSDTGGWRQILYFTRANGKALVGRRNGAGQGWAVYSD
ncbi:MAG: hypothetical protein JXR76_27245 [Deltaproteobacteria bacterium]|nr:hypothetical protein [Deltaproteobacteria bacterium]